MSRATLRRHIREGCPTEGTRLNTADVAKWILANDRRHLEFEKSKIRDKEAQASLRELQFEQEQSRLIDVDYVVKCCAAENARVRQRCHALKSQITSRDPVEMMEQLDAAVHDALSAITTDAT